MSVADAFLSSARSAGRAILRSVDAAGSSLALFLECVRRLPVAPPSLRPILDQMYQGGVLSVLIVILVGLFSGMVLTLQTGIELAKLGQQDLVGPIVSVAMCREMGPFITGTILAAAVGSAMAAELGTMAVSEELTALDVMTVDVTRFLVLPRVVALAIMCPILTLFADIVGIIGGGLIAVYRLGVGRELFATTALEELKATTFFFGFPKDIYVGVIKAFIFGITISIIGCAAGMQATSGARGVGEATRTAVRTSIMMIVILNYLVTAFFYR